ncbi:phage terminase large subunit family protein [Ruixingdingia sedimenti]|uniref:Phage terminase large subunit family protein n=1 Tax=Ruixingdingia sedimenti TaxID=3073604 RepID=A0ABU1FEF9_9RHOB|nr:phage terminase large subunit family protein [Xinfangfangia sp. LG-4]MDR5655255.1 phage terminase large subunit family protein [Xinfangfangia sp. LG-4]
MPLDDQIAAMRAAALQALRPPAKLRGSEFIEREIRLPQGVSATPGPVRLWGFQRGIADALADPLIERVSVLKATRVGYSMLAAASIAGFIANDPGPVLVVLPTDQDARGFTVDDLEPTFAASPIVATALADDTPEGERNTLTSRRFPGGSLKIVAARSPRNLRRHNAKYLILDEIDAMDMTPEGDPITLATQRTISFSDRKLIAGSTPTYSETSHILRLYGQSDQRVFQVPCPACGSFGEVLFSGIVWDPGRPDTARWRCPHCSEEIEERHKPQMVEEGRWSITRPEVQNHAGFKVSALTSPHPNASWAKLAAEFLAAKDTPELLQVFTNCALAEGWRSEGEELDESALQARAEPIGLDPVPEAVLCLTSGVDVQRDRLEASILGHGATGTVFALAHFVLWGAYDDADTWAQLDALLSTRWPHALGGKIGLDAVCIDSSDGVSQPQVYAFCAGRHRRRIVPIKGVAGFSRPPLERAARAKGKTVNLYICGVDGLKSRLFAGIKQAGAWRFSDSLTPTWYEQLCSEAVQIKYSRGQPTRQFVRLGNRAAEGLDCCCYGLAARSLVTFNPETRRAELAHAEPVTPARRPVLESAWMARR